MSEITNTGSTEGQDFSATPSPQDSQDAAADSAINGEELNQELILNVPVSLAIEIGRTSLPIGELLNLNPGSVVELDRGVGEPHDVLVNGTLIAHGEVVVINERFGVRFTDIISPKERVNRLK